jgi:hypothetical protein
MACHEDQSSVGLPDLEELSRWCPEGVRREGRRPGQNRLGDFLARCAQLEAASVFSFSRLVRELEAYGAPKHLIARTRQARADEVRHAAVVGALARDH